MRPLGMRGESNKRAENELGQVGTEVGAKVSKPWNLKGTLPSQSLNGNIRNYVTKSHIETLRNVR